MIQKKTNKHKKNGQFFESLSGTLQTARPKTNKIHTTKVSGFVTQNV